MLKKTVLLIIVMVIALVPTISLCTEVQNILFNNSFELTKDGKPTNWVTKSWINDPGAVEYKLETDNPQSGEKYVSITNNVESHSRYIQSVLVEENKKYKISGYIKTENISENGKGANISIENQVTTSRRIKGTTKDWEYVELYALINKGVNKIHLSVNLGGYSGTCTGKAFFDNIIMEEVDSIPEGASFAEINNNSDELKTNSNNVKKKISGTEATSKIVLVVLIIAVIVVTIVTVKSKKKLLD
jgi:hypothetical protein